jgi:hypothetical protein
MANRWVARKGPAQRSGPDGVALVVVVALVSQHWRRPSGEPVVGGSDESFVLKRANQGATAMGFNGNA